MDSNPEHRLGARPWLVGLLLVVLGCSAFALAWAPAQHASPDSAVYLDAARQLAEGNGFVTARIPRHLSEPAPITAWPPAFPLLLAGGVALGLSPAQAAAALLTLSFVAFGAFAYGLMLLASEPRWWPLAVLLVVPVVLHPGTLRSLDAILTDLPFAACATGWLALALIAVRRERPTARAVFVFGLLAAGVVMVRWAGLYWVAAVALGLVVARGAAWGGPATLRTVGVFGLGMATVLLPWLVRNLVQAGTLMGTRHATPTDPIAAAGAAAQGIFSSLAAVGPVSPLLIGLAALATVAAGVATRERRDGVIVVLVAVALGYPALMVASWALSPFDPLTRERFWLPLWPVGAALFIATLSRCQGRRGLTLGYAAIGLALLAPATVSFTGAAAHGLPGARRETGLASEVWAGSAPVRFLRDAGTDCAWVASEPRVHLIHNAPPVVYTLPTHREQLAPLLDRSQRLCIVYMRQRSSGSAERHRADHVALIRMLETEGRARRVAADPVGEVWIVEADTR